MSTTAMNNKPNLDGNGWPIIDNPPRTSPVIWAMNFFLLNTIVTIFVPVLLAIKRLRKELNLSDLADLYKTVADANSKPINMLPEYQDKELIRKLWETDSAKVYVERDALEYQIREGFCSSATIRCTLKSFASFPPEKIPPQKEEPSDPIKWKEMDVWTPANGNDQDSNLEIIPGSCSYDEFLSAVKRGLEDSSCRVVLNFLRPVLFGFSAPWLLPANLILGLFSGHFSPIVGMIETETYKGDNPLIGIFDVNHKYGGAYLVPAKTLFRSVQAIDATTSKPRAMILIQEPVLLQ